MKKPDTLFDTDGTVSREGYFWMLYNDPIFKRAHAYCAHNKIRSREEQYLIACAMYSEYVSQLQAQIVDLTHTRPVYISDVSINKG